MADLLIRETGNGGDLVLKGNDLAMVSGAENMPYLSMFGGVNWWGNDLLLGEDIDLQFNSESEAAINDISLNSAGRVALENAASVSGMILTTECALIDIKEENAGGGMPMGGGMPGMM